MNVRRLNRLARQLREVALRASQNNDDLPLSTGELAIVEYVARNPGSSVTTIAQHTGLAQSRVSTVVRHLTDEHVFDRVNNTKDRRRTCVQLSPHVAIQAFEEFGSRPIEDALAAAAPHLSPTDAHRVTRLLDELSTLIEPPQNQEG